MRVLIVDEAHSLKSRVSKRTEALKAFNFGACVLLTGTPLQNNTDELWTLLNFIDPKKFNNLEARRFAHSTLPRPRAFGAAALAP